MTDVQLAFDEIVVGEMFLPRISLRRGEQLCLHFPRSGMGADYDVLYDFGPALGRGEVPYGIKIDGHIVFADKPMPRPGLLFWRYDPKVIDWLTDHAGLSVDVAMTILERRNISPRIRIGTLPWQDRCAPNAQCIECPADRIVEDTAA